LFDSGGDASRGSSSSSGDRIDTDEGSVITVICKILGVFVGRRRVATTTTTTTTTTEEDDDDAADQRTVGRCSPLLMCAALDVLSSLWRGMMELQWGKVSNSTLEIIIT
jgi:hypothetical protein